MPWLTPDFASWGVKCYRVWLPDNDTLRAAYRGALFGLGDSSNWELEGTATPEQVAQAFLSLEIQNSEMVVCMPIGSIIWGVWSTTPEGFLDCDGSQYDTVVYEDLFSILGYNFGGSGSLFAVPNLARTFIIGSGGGLAIGDTGGTETETLNTSQIPEHDHPTHTHLEGLAVSPGELPVTLPGILPGSTGNTGGGGSHNNMPPYMALRAVISYR